MEGARQWVAVCCRRGLDKVRLAVGGFVVGAGAKLPDGRGWTVVPERTAIKDAPPLPLWLAAMLRPQQRETVRGKRGSETSDERGRAYAVAALDGGESELAAAPAGERNERLYKTAFRLATMAARGWLTENEIIETLLRACEGNHYLREHGHGATTKTIESGIAGGLSVPHDDLENRDVSAGPTAGGDVVDPEQHRQPTDRPRRFRTTEVGTIPTCQS